MIESFVTTLTLLYSTEHSTLSRGSPCHHVFCVPYSTVSNLVDDQSGSLASPPGWAYGNVWSSELDMIHPDCCFIDNLGRGGLFSCHAGWEMIVQKLLIRWSWSSFFPNILLAPQLIRRELENSFFYPSALKMRKFWTMILVRKTLFTIFCDCSGFVNSQNATSGVFQLAEVEIMPNPTRKISFPIRYNEQNIRIYSSLIQGPRSKRMSCIPNSS